MKRVLIADDEPIERMIVSRTVEKYFSEELTVVSAANGREAVEQFFAGDCQIALLDIEMPGMNGLEAAEQIRKRDKNCSIIFLTCRTRGGADKRQNPDSGAAGRGARVRE